MNDTKLLIWILGNLLTDNQLDVKPPMLCFALRHYYASKSKVYKWFPTDWEMEMWDHD